MFQEPIDLPEDQATLARKKKAATPPEPLVTIPRLEATRRVMWGALAGVSLLNLFRFFSLAAAANSAFQEAAAAALCVAPSAIGFVICRAVEEVIRDVIRMRKDAGLP